MNEQYVDTPQQLEQLCAALQGSTWLALDTEFMHQDTYYAELCLLQVSNGEIAASIDTLALKDLSPMLALIADPDITKVFHAGRQDLDIFFARWQLRIEPIFDTQIAAALLGVGEQIGYGDLVEQVLGHHLEKGQTRTDWRRRPLSPGQLRYALDDVIYLGHLYINLAHRLGTRGRLDWLTETVDALNDVVCAPPQPEDMWKKVKGRGRLRGTQLAVLQAIAAWRERRAITLNLPRPWVLKDDAMLGITERRPTRLSQLTPYSGRRDVMARGGGEELLHAITTALARPPSVQPTMKQHTSLSPEQRALVPQLSARLKILAEAAEVSATLIARRADLEKLAGGAREIPLLTGWRREIAGADLLERVKRAG